MSACAFIGHRPSHFPFQYDETHPDCLCLKQRLQTEITKLIYEGVTTFLTGMALGVDTWAAEIVLEEKQQHPALRLVAVIPCETQASKWSGTQRDRYYNILSQCDEEVYVSRRYTSGCMFARNRYLVDHCDILLAMYGGIEKGGTAYTLHYAQSKKRRVLVIPTKTS